MKKNMFWALLTMILVLSTSQVMAFDGHRKGFMLNLGGGFGQGKFTASSGNASGSLDGMGFCSDLKVGGGISNQTVLYYTNRALWYTIEDDNSTAELDLVNGMSGIGVTHFFNPKAPSPFFSGAIGLGILKISDADESETGVGFTMGVGYEFSENWIIEGTYMQATVAEEMGIDLKVSSLAITLSWFAY